jgi:hypothetical protein
MIKEYEVLKEGKLYWTEAGDWMRGWIAVE